MTDQTEPMPEPQWGNGEPDGYTAPPIDWEQAHPLERKPQALDTDSHMANHLITISFTPKGQPMVVVRGNTPQAVAELLGDLADFGVYMHLAGAQQAMLGSVPPAETIMQQLGGTIVPPQPGPYNPQQPTQGYGQQPAPQGQQWPPPGAPQPSPGQPPFGAPQGGYAPPQPAWGGGANQPPQRPQGWYAVKIPYNQKDAGDQVKLDLKNQQLYTGNVKWEAETKTWLVSPQVVQWFAQWRPVPA